MPWAQFSPNFSPPYRVIVTRSIRLRALGDLQAARDLDQDTLDRRCRILGQDHPDTLASADNLAADLRALAERDDNI